MSFREPNGAVMTNMKPPQEGRNTGAPSLRGLQGRSATGLNGQAAKEEVSAMWQGGWMPENISGVPAGRSVFHLTSPFIGPLRRSVRYCDGWTLNRALLKSSGWNTSSRCRTPDRSAQATSRLPIEGMMRRSRTARGFGFCSGTEFVAEPSSQCFKCFD